MTYTTVDQAAGIASTTDEMVEQYRGIPLAQLKQTTRNKLNKFWADVTSGMVKFEPHVTSVELLGSDFLISSTKLFWKGYLSSCETVTLEELAATRETEQESQHLQFEIQMTRVEKLLTDKDDGLLGGRPLMQPIICMRLPQSEQFVIVSGRHRVSAFLTLAQLVSGWEEFEIPVLMYEAHSAIEVASFVRTANGSRNMTATEKAMIEGAANGINLSVYREADELFADAAKVENITQLKKFNRSIWGSFLSNSVVDASCSINGIGDIGNSALNQLIKRLKELEKGSEKMLLEMDGDTPMYQAIVTKMMEWTKENWNGVIRGEIQEPKKVRGSVVLDENNQPIMLFNPSRKASDIGKIIGNNMADRIAETLAKAWAQISAQQKAEKEAKRAEKAKSSVSNDIKNLDNVMALMKSQGTLTPELEASMLEQRQALLQQVADEASKANQEKQQAMQVAQAKVPGVDPNSLF